MIKNNSIALGILFMMDVIMVGLTGLLDWSLSFLSNSFLAVLDGILVGVMVVLFVFFSKKWLVNQGSKIKDLLSVSFIFVLGVVEAFHYANLDTNIGGNIDPFSFIYEYGSPILMLYYHVRGGAHFIVADLLGSHQSRLISCLIASVIPPLLMWIGMGLRNKRSQ